VYQRFTDRARKVMQLANQEAQRLRHEYIATEHILVGLVKEGSGVAANVLKNLDVDLRKLREEVERIVQTGPAEHATAGRLPHTPRAKKVIEYAIEEARNLNHNYVGTEHLLLWLLRDSEGVAAQVLMNLGLRLDDVRREVLNLLGHNPLPDGPGVVLHRIDAVLTPSPAPADVPADPLPAEFAALDVVIDRLTDLKEQAVAAQKFVEAAWFLEQVKLLRQVRVAILRRPSDG
jgi:ATP-dependent Clp protease ATP-binding subunit ClpA